MIKQTIEISGHGNHLFLSQESLCIRRGRQTVGRLPLEDIGLLILDAADTTYTHHVLVGVLEFKGAVLLCGKDHHPAGLMLPQNNSLQTQRLLAQANATKPLRKQLWKQVVQAKLRNQAAVLPEVRSARSIRNLIGKVRSGDPSNIEAQGARRYWKALFGKEFRRGREGKPPNNLLNYGYMAMRAAVARSITAAGLHPSLGLHHHNRSNHFCLADDLMEPLRPLVDKTVARLHGDGIDEITRESKVELLQLLTDEVEVSDNRGPVMVALERTMASLVRCYQGECRKLELPSLCN
jgi:CRISPR-associated protein Cas1